VFKGGVFSGQLPGENSIQPSEFPASIIPIYSENQDKHTPFSIFGPKERCRKLLSGCVHRFRAQLFSRSPFASKVD
jgi:hypothetical protein